MVSKVRIPPSQVPLVDSNGNITTPWYRYLYSEWEVTGGDSDDVVSTNLRELYPFPNLYHELMSLRVHNQIISSDYTSTGNQVLIVTTNSTITLNPYPKHLEKVTIKHAAPNRVDVSGSIDGGSSYAMLAKYESLTFIYSADQSEWYII